MAQIKLVIADDEVFIRQAYKDSFERDGYVVQVAEDGVQALEIIKSFKPDVVLLDLIMPKVNGFDVLKSLKSDPELSKIPVIVLSNLSQPTDEAEVLKNGAALFLVKSDYSLKQLEEKIRGLVEV